MINNLCFTYGAILFFSLFELTYFMKKKIKSVKTTIFSIFIIVCETFMLSLAALIYINKNYDLEILERVLWTLHWSLTNIGFYFLFLYLYYIGYRLNKNTFLDTIKDNKYILILTIVTVIEFICEWTFIPYDGFNINNIEFIHASTRIYSLIISIFISYVFFKTRKNLEKDERFATSFAFIMCGLFIILQLIFPNIMFVSIGVCFVILSIYFNIENTDLFILKNINEITDGINKTNSCKTLYLDKMKNEINAPINRINELSNELSILSVYNDDKYYDLLYSIKKSSYDLLNILNNSFNMISLNLSKENNSIKDYSYEELIHKAYFYLCGKINDKKITLTFNVSENISKRFFGDENKLYLALKNIIDVCVDKTYVGKIIVEFTSTIKENTEELHIHVSDTSDGFNEEDLKNINNENTEMISDEQLVILAKKYINSIGGVFTFNSKKNIGNKFDIVLNQTISNKEKIGKFDLENSNKINYIDLSKYTIAVVDDDPLNLKIIKKILNKYNNNCETFTNARELINNIKLDKKYDLVLTDLNMPIVSGEDTLLIINTLVTDRKLPVVALTSNAIDGMKENYLTKGFSDYLTKPFNRYEFDVTIKKFLK